ncbi:MAG: AI-2E family transporter [Halanaerobiales bacterium]
MLESKFTKIAINIILILLIFFLLGQFSYLINVFKVISTVIIVPLLMGGFFYYLLRPLTRFLSELVHNRYISVLITFLLIIGIIVFVSYFGGSIILTQMEEFINTISDFYQSLREGERELFKIDDYLPMFDNINLEERIVSFVERLINIIKNNIGVLVSTITNIGTTMILIPFVLFYLLVDDKQLWERIISGFSQEKKDRYLPTFKKIDSTLASYLNSQLLVALVLGVLTYLGYLIIGLPSALILAIIAMVTSLIPFIGPILGAIPALLIGLTANFYLIIKILIVIFVVQQLEGNVIRPNIQGGKLKIHPLVVIFTISISIILFGFFGALFAVPVYAVLRIILKDLVLTEGKI